MSEKPYEWRFCKTCNERFFSNEVENIDFLIIDKDLYCLYCAEEKQTEVNK